MSVSQGIHKNCYGTMFPSILCLEADRVVSGKVFSFELGVPTGHSSPNVGLWPIRKHGTNVVHAASLPTATSFL